MRKLVRDEIPKIIEKTGRGCNVRVLDEEEYFLELKKKLVEEVDEFLAETNLEELADIVEVIYALAKAIGHDVKKLDSMRRKKKSERGAFEQKLFLESTDN
ncbi:Nucleoside triphosphate pyrophosphohydrolase [Rickettsiales endosymbiont of Paramecium tredecaurelia]|uniref:nucleoside triphosphate pyrophosphohydrolase n=1 Tax=Candidatus Sarmatiella mevalonica TaxID=2770581 RepID=UPI00192262A0|nr:nucleoside triphosphate pyrophosphohydrolase [Candidatus Sarmatiella mevalonica]MBL3284209.1 Nucleoside triphosphate pyrophosphohydrolase [Candidatus Sarmatiella mevalonica]